MVTTGMKLKDTYFLEGKLWQEYWSGLPCPPTGELLHPGIKPGFPALQVDSLPTELPTKPHDKPRQCIKKQKHHFTIKGLCQNYDFPVVMYAYESWNIKEADHQRTDAFKSDAGEDCWESLGLQGDKTSQS